MGEEKNANTKWDYDSDRPCKQYLPSLRCTTQTSSASSPRVDFPHTFAETIHTFRHDIVHRPPHTNPGTFTHIDMLPQHTLTSQGVEPQPGPTLLPVPAWLQTFYAHPLNNYSLDSKDFPHCILLESQNVASLAKHFAAATSRTVHCAALQETCVDKAHIDTTKARFTGAGWDRDVSVPCPDTAKPTAGVATAVKHHGHCSQPHTHTHLLLPKPCRPDASESQCATAAGTKHSTFAIYMDALMGKLHQGRRDH